MADRAQVQGIGDVGAPGEFLRCALEKIVFFESRVSLKIARDVLDALSTRLRPIQVGVSGAPAQEARAGLQRGLRDPRPGSWAPPTSRPCSR